MIIVYVHTVPPSEWLHQGLLSHSGEISVAPSTQRSTHSLQSHMGAGWIFYLSNPDLCHEFVCIISTVRDGCLSLQPFVPAGTRGCCCSISQTDRQTDTLTGIHWSHSSSGDQTPTASPELCCRALSVFVLITVIFSCWGPLLANHISC